MKLFHTGVLGACSYIATSPSKMYNVANSSNMHTFLPVKGDDSAINT